MSPPFPPTDPRSSYHGRVIAVGGPPHSGKSVFLADLATFQSCLITLPQQQLDSTARSAIQTDLPIPQGTLVNLSRDLGAVCYEEAIAQFADWLILQTS